MTEMIHSTQARTLYTIAVEDESTLVYPLPDAIFGFHAQQSCEKLFKSLIFAHGLTPPLTHVLLELTRILERECAETAPEVPYRYFRLQKFAVQYRYESGIEVSEVDRAAIRQTVAILRAHTLTRILAIQQT